MMIKIYFVLVIINFNVDCISEDDNQSKCIQILFFYPTKSAYTFSAHLKCTANMITNRTYKGGQFSVIELI